MGKTQKADSPAEAFLTSNRITIFLIDELSDEQLAFAVNSRSRSVADQFAHLHQVRLSWLEVINPAVAKTLSKTGKGQISRKTLKDSLNDSAAAIAGLLDESFAAGTMKGYKKGPSHFFAYLIAHEAHHRGQILLHLKNAGLAFDRTKSFAIWDWAKM